LVLTLWLGEGFSSAADGKRLPFGHPHVIPEGESTVHPLVRENPRRGSRDFEQLAEQLMEVQKTPSRALHAKGIGVRGVLTVSDDVWDPARVGIFASAGTYNAYVRFSNGSPRRQSDKKPDVRGLAVKLLDVPGRKVIPGLEDATTHDLLFIRSTHVPFRSAEEFVWVARASQNQLTFIPRALFHLGPKRAIGLLRELLGGLSLPYPSAAADSFFTALPIQFGDHAAKLALFPQSPTAPTTSQAQGEDYIGGDVAARLLAGPIRYDLRAQFFVDEASTPIEVPNQEWLERDAPFVTIATLELPKQDIAGTAGEELQTLIEALSFDPWHAPLEFRPLGALMRARNVAYRRSTQARGAKPEISVEG